MDRLSDTALQVHLPVERLLAPDLSALEQAHVDACPECWFERLSASGFNEVEAVPQISMGIPATAAPLERFSLVRWAGLSRWGQLHEVRGDDGLPYEIVWIDQAVATRVLDRAEVLTRPPRHPGLANIFAADLDGDPPWLVRELIKGQRLWEHLQRDDADAAGVFHQLLLALDVLHGSDIAHGAVSGASVRIEQGGRAVWMDVGLGEGDVASDVSAFRQLLSRAAEAHPALKLAARTTDRATMRLALDSAGAGRVGRYVDGPIIGTGGMAEVRRVTEPTLKRDVAMKIIAANLADDAVARSRFLQEAQITAQLQHPGIPAVHEVGTLPDGRSYYTMREVRGQTLARIIAARRNSRGEWTLRRLLEVLLRASEAVGYAHSRGVVHRDLKPANVMAGEFGEVMVLDWGLARLHAEAEPTVKTDRSGSALATRDGTVAGTPAFMAPEQARGDVSSIGPATDVYALGAILYTVLAGRPPYEGPSGSVVVQQVLGQDPTPLEGVPATLGALCDLAMSRDPADRPRDAAAFAEVLREELAGARRLQLAASDWEASGRPPALLWQPPLLDEYHALHRGGAELTPLEHAFGEASVEALTLASARDTASRRFRWRAAALFASAVAVGAFAYWDLAVAERTSAWEEVQDFGLGPTPIGPLTAQTLRDHYRVVRQGRRGRIDRYEFVNAAGSLTTATPWMRDLFGDETGEEQTGDCRFEVNYDDRGDYIGTSVFDAHGRVRWHYELGNGVGQLLSRFGYTLAAQRGAAFMKVEARERQIEVSFRDAGGQPAAAMNFAGGVRFELDDEGRLKRRTWLDADGQAFAPPADRDIDDPRYELLPAGWEESRQGPVRVRRYFDTAGDRAVGAHGCEEERVERDESGREISWTCSVDGELALSFDGIATRKTTYPSDAPNEFRVDYFGLDGLPTRHLSGHGAYIAKYDAQGRTSERQRLGIDNLPYMDRDGWSTVRYRWSDAGDKLSELGLNAVDKPVSGRAGYARMDFDYDTRGNLVARAQFDAASKLTVSRFGWAQIRYAIDDLDRQVGWAVFDEDGLAVRDERGRHRVQRVFDDRGNLVRSDFFDESDEPTSSSEGVATVVQTWDSRGNKVRVQYAGVHGEPVPHRDGYAATEYSYDGRGQVIAETTVDIDGEPVAGPGGYVTRRRVFDGLGRLSETAHYDANGSLVVDDKTGVVRSVRSVLADGWIRWSYYGRDGEPTYGRDGAPVKAMRYDRFGRKIATKYLDAAGRPTLGRGGFSSSQTARDSRGREMSITTFDSEENRVVTGAGYAEQRNVRDGRGNLVEYGYFGADGEPAFNRPRGYSKTTAGYDSRGRRTTVAYFGAGGEPIRLRTHKRNDDEGFHRMDSVFDPYGNAIEKRYYDVDGTLTDEVMGFAQSALTFDAHGQWISTAYFDREGRPVSPLDARAGTHRSVKTFDAYGRFLEQKLYGTDGQLNVSKRGWASVRWQVDTAGRSLRVEYFDANGRPANTPRGATRVYERDTRGRIVVEAYTDARGEPMETTDGMKTVCARRELSRNLAGHVTSLRCFAGNSSLVRTYHQSFDNHGREVEQHATDGNGDPAVLLDGSMERRSAYDMMGNRISRHLYDSKGNLAPGNRGFASQHRSYNARGDYVGELYLDENDEPVIAWNGCAALRFRWQPGDGSPVQAWCSDLAGAEVEVPPRKYYRRLFSET